MNEPITIEVFSPHVGQRVSFAGHPVALLLAAADPKPRATMPGADRVAFALLFHGPRDDILPAGLYRAILQDGPEIEFYLQPIHTMAQDRQEYQAVFN